MECYYFGTFDPPHEGHIKMAKKVKEKLNFSKVIFIPAPNPCHKSAASCAIDRLNMLKLVEFKGMKVSDIEFRLEKPSYSYKTILELLKTTNSKVINFIIGFDAFKNIENWKHSEVLKKNVHFIVLKRKGENREEIEKLKPAGWNFEIMEDIDTVDISSSEIRDKVQKGVSIAGLVDKKVQRYIVENGLYK